MDKRTAEDMVKDLLAKKVSWPGILSIARVCRGGEWRARAKEILQERGIMPKDDAEADEQRDAAIAKQQKANAEVERKDEERRHSQRAEEKQRHGARKPLPPGEIVDALQNQIHKESTKSRPAKAAKTKVKVKPPAR